MQTTNDFYVTGNGRFAPGTPRALVWMEKQEVGSEHRLRICTDVSPAWFAKFMGLMEGVHANQPTNLSYKNKGALRAALLMEVGYTELVQKIGGGQFLHPRSMAWDKMTGTQFEEIYNSIIPILQDEPFWPGMSKEDVENIRKSGMEPRLAKLLK